MEREDILREKKTVSRHIESIMVQVGQMLQVVPRGRQVHEKATELKDS